MISTHEPHTVKSFDTELTRLHQMIQRMGELSCLQLDAALRAFEAGDQSLAETVIADDNIVNVIEKEINEQVVRILALHAPVANDLRIVISSLSVATALKRVARHAVSMARHVDLLRENAAFPAALSVVRLGRLVLESLKEGLDAFTESDIDKALQVWERDNEVDALYSSLFRELLTYMLETPRNITVSIQLMMLAKNLERVGDHATTLAETVWFIVKGVQIHEVRPKSDVTVSLLPMTG